IYKRMWEHTGRERQLETSLAFYLRGFRQGVRSDYGYTAINAAFVLDVLADIESPDNLAGVTFTEVAPQRRVLARQIREAIVAELPALAADGATAWLNTTWWFLVTLGEAYFGLARYDEATDWFRQAAALPDVPDWERESTARQLARLFLIQERDAGDQRELLRARPIGGGGPARQRRAGPGIGRPRQARARALRRRLPGVALSHRRAGAPRGARYPQAHRVPVVRVGRLDHRRPLLSRDPQAPHGQARQRDHARRLHRG